jgi:uncharacterized protein (DUF433 family)
MRNGGKPMNAADRLLSCLSIDPEIRFGKPCVSGTRIAVTDILQWLASGVSQEEILADYPCLKAEHIRAALMFAADRETYIKIIPSHASAAFA